MAVDPRTDKQAAASLGAMHTTGGRGSRKASDQTIYDSIYQAVLTQRLPPGSKLPEVALSELFGVSRSIVRKALTRLASDHVTEQSPNQMAVVARPGIEETRQIFAARRLVEGEVTRLVAGTLGKSEAQALRKLIKEEKSAHERGQDQHRVHCSMAIHQYLARQCPNQVLGKMMLELVLRTSIVIALYKAPGITACFLGNDHGRLADLIIKGEADQAAQLAREHLDTLEGLLDLDEPSGDIDLASILRYT
ncbi:GntR family transcriptional regulator [Alcanivorax balearicus MACL04]|uniref:GntR family transcriptional regulator n=1 Tax=Alloalcanivorax balearicus MACL04 TaxID=1177182 RepID=A0ABT2QW27_9GAMM|nr:GntR family transcriptional regulator [Alloalcanivorax balearicus]MCU5781721.1 GntR family transcriptional regulator [Alloalcanivorax balearicus MACL04]